jgi:hypothetical protein
VDEIKRLGRFAFERVWLVTEESLDRVWVALQPLIEQMFARLEALTILLHIIATLLIQIWLEIQLQPGFDNLGKALAETVSRLIFVGFLLLVAGGLLLVVLVSAIAVITDRSIRRQTTSRPESTDRSLPSGQ